jgi:hypothetical protein
MQCGRQRRKPIHETGAPFFSAALQGILGGALLFVAGILIGSS